MTDVRPDYLDWIDDPQRQSGFDLLAGAATARRAALDDAVRAAEAHGLPVVRLDGTRSGEWSAQLQLAVGPFSLSLDVQHRPGGDSPAPDPAPAPGPAPAPKAEPTAEPTAGATGTDLDRSVQELARVAIARGGAVLAVDDLHRVPAAVRRELYEAVQATGAPILLLGTSTPSQAHRLESTAAPVSQARTAALGHPAPDRSLGRTA